MESQPIDVICFTLSRGSYKRPSRSFTTMGNAGAGGAADPDWPQGTGTGGGSAAHHCAGTAPLNCAFVELTENRERMQMGPYVIDAYRVNHNVMCYGYSITIPVPTF